MEIEYKPWEWTVEVAENCYKQVKADEETRKRQLEEYKKERIEELEREIERVKMLH